MCILLTNIKCSNLPRSALKQVNSESERPLKLARGKIKDYLLKTYNKKTAIMRSS